MGRFTDLVLVIVALFLLYVATFSAGAMLNPLSDAVLDTGISSDYNASENFSDMVKAVTVWVPTTGAIGLIGLVVMREYRRQRIAAATRGVR